MDRKQFDALARALATTGSRRGALGTILSMALFRQSLDALAKGGKKKKRNHGSKSKDKHRRRDRDRHKHNSRGVSNRQDEPVQAEASGCCGKKSCPFPGKKSNSAECNFAGANLAGTDGTLANLQYVDGRKTIFSTQSQKGIWNQANFSYACLGDAKFTGADLRKANFSYSCLIDADLSNAQADISTNFFNATLCRTKMPNGSMNNAGCTRATSCCPACNNDHPCPEGQVCCNGKCFSGNCCATSDCPTLPCRNKTCSGRQCTYSPITGTTGPLCNSVCCSGRCCRLNGATTCNAEGRCGCDTDEDCDNDQRCCEGTCQDGDCCEAEDCPPTGNICEAFQCACGDGAECSGATPNCCGEGSGAICRECCDDTQCPDAEPFCLDFACVECLSDSDCDNPTPVCNGNNRCVACNANNPCNGGEVCCNGSCFTGVCCNDNGCPDPGAPDCIDHECVCQANGGPPCGAGQACCATGCENVQTDPANCGACGFGCPAGQQCVNGDCVCPTIVCNGICCPTGDTCAFGGSKCSCVVDADCPIGVCCGGVCEFNFGCGVGQGCSPGTCLPGLDCVPVQDPVNEPANTCQDCCSPGPNPCAEGFQCEGDPRYCGGCPDGKCCVL